MKLILLIVLLCGITSTPARIADNSMKAKKNSICNTKTTNAEASAINLEMVPSGLLFQF